MIVKPLNEYPLVPLTSELAEIMMNLILSSQRAAEPDPELVEVMEQDPLCRLITARAAHHGFKLTTEVVLMVATLSEGIPGQAVQLLHALRVNPLTNNADVTMDQFCHIFANGVPSENSYSMAWNDQKSDGRNMIDDHAAWEK